MRDAQSLLDQLLAFGGAEERLTLEQVHRLLGTATDDRVVALASAVLEKDVKGALELLAQAAAEGLQLGELLDQLIDYWRDLMVVNCAGGAGRDLSVSARHREGLARQAGSLSIDTILAGLDILSTTKGRLRASSHGRTLIEMALVRLGRLENLVSLAQLSQWLASGKAPDRQAVVGAPRLREGTAAATPAAGLAPTARPPRPVTLPETPEKKNGHSEPTTIALTAESVQAVWHQVLAQVGGMYAGHLEKASSLAISGPNTLVLTFSSVYNTDREYCQESSRVTRITELLRKVTGRAWNLRFDTVTDSTPESATPATDADKSQPRYLRQRTEALQEPLVKRALEVLGAQIVHVDEGFGAAPTEPPDPQAEADSEEM
jgi:DNA polymerase-3 subunit gamma/tau